MNWKTTLMLLVLVAGMGTWVYLGESKLDSTPDLRKDMGRIVKKFKAEDATKVSIKRGKGLADEVVLVKDGAFWKMEKPAVDKADEGKVRELLAPIEFLEPSVMKEGDEAKKAPFGEVQMRLEVTRSADKGGDVVLEFGAPGIGDTRYLRVGGRENVIYLIKKELPDRVLWDAFDLRSKELFTLGATDVGKLSAKTPGTDAGPSAPTRLLELVRAKDSSWRLGAADGEIAESKKVTDVLEKVHALKAKGVVSDKPQDAELAQWGLAPAAEIEISLLDSADKSTKTETLLLGKKIDAAKDERYAKVAGKPTVYKLDLGELVKELSKDPVSFRSDTLVPLSGGTEAATALSAKWKGGREWKLVKKEQDWSFEVPKAKGDNEAVKGLLKGIAELKISTREEGSDPAKFGLAEPAFTFTIIESDTPRTIQVGNSAEGGVYYVRRAGESRIYSSKLGELAKRLEDAAIGARSKQLFKASYWEMTAFKLASPDGKVELAGEKKGNDWTVEGYAKPEDVDTSKLSAAFQPVELLTADALVAEVTSESLVQYGLDKPRTLTCTVESWEQNTNAKKKEERTLLLGKREGDSVYALDKGGSAIGKVKAEFLDLFARGFRKGKQIWEYSQPQCFSMVVKDGDKEVARFEKKKDGLLEDWYLGEKKVVSADFQKILNAFERLEGSAVEDATPASKKARKLDPPLRAITFQTKAPWGEKKDEVTTKTLLLGDRNGERDLWAMDQAGTEIGSVFDAANVKLDAFLAAPSYAKEDKKEGTAPIATPTAPNK